jgi:hypothetical protein
MISALNRSPSERLGTFDVAWKRCCLYNSILIIEAANGARFQADPVSGYTAWGIL